MTTINLRNAFIVALISICILLSQDWEETTNTTSTVTNTPPLTRSKEDLDLLGVSVHHLANNFMDLVRAKYPDSAERMEAQRKFKEAVIKHDLLPEGKLSELKQQNKKEYKYVIGLFDDFKEKPSSKDTTIYQIEDLRDLDTNGIIREKGKDTKCPIDGRKGAAYVHTLQGASNKYICI